MKRNGKMQRLASVLGWMQAVIGVSSLAFNVTEEKLTTLQFWQDGERRSLGRRRLH